MKKLLVALVALAVMAPACEGPTETTIIDRSVTDTLYMPPDTVVTPPDTVVVPPDTVVLPPDTVIVTDTLTTRVPFPRIYVADVVSKFIMRDGSFAACENWLRDHFGDLPCEFIVHANIADWEISSLDATGALYEGTPLRVLKAGSSPTWQFYFWLDYEDTVGLERGKWHTVELEFTSPAWEADDSPTNNSLRISTEGCLPDEMGRCYY